MAGWRRNDSGASPLTVILSIAVFAAGVTALVLMAVLGGAREALSVQEVREQGRTAFQVTQSEGGLSWSDLTVHFVDRAGYDRATAYLDLPDGAVETGDRIQVRAVPPAGTYLLTVSDGGDVLARLAVVLP